MFLAANFPRDEERRFILAPRARLLSSGESAGLPIIRLLEPEPVRGAMGLSPRN